MDAATVCVSVRVRATRESLMKFVIEGVRTSASVTITASTTVNSISVNPRLA
jgi:hypothetical protein